LQFYPFLLRYLSSHSRDKISEIFAMIIESCHELVPPETMRPIIEKIVTNFCSEFCQNVHITIGLNAVREILLRMPLALDKNQVEYLCLFKSNKNKSVAGAAKSLVNYFRDVCPELLPNRRLQGRFTKVDETNKIENIEFGQERAARGIEGLELLERYERAKGRLKEGEKIDRILGDDDLKKIKILLLKEGVKRVDRHGFALGGQPETDAIDYDKIGAEMAVTKEREAYLAKAQEL
jgi:protein SDA1